MAQNIRSVNKPKFINYFPTKSYGQDGDIIVSRIKGKGVFLCVKAGGSWYAQTAMQPLQKINTSYIKNLSSDKLTIKNLQNAGVNTDRFIVAKNGDIKYRTTNDILSDLGLEGINSFDIDYKTAYCSLEQYSDKETCEANGGTWYYSDNDSHDSISSTAENQLLTVSQSIGSVDAEPNLLYNGKTLEIKSTSDYDEDWSSISSDHAGNIKNKLLQFTHDEDNYAYFEFQDVNNYLNLFLYDKDTGDADGGVFQISGYAVDSGDGSGSLITQNNIKFIVGQNSNTYSGSGMMNEFTSNKTLEMDISGSLELHVNSRMHIYDGAGNAIIELDPANTHIRILDDSDTDDFFDIQVSANGATVLSTTDDTGTAGHLTLDIDGDITLDADGGDVFLKDDGTQFMKLNVDGVFLKDNAAVHLNDADIDKIYGDGDEIYIAKDDTDIWCFKDAETLTEVPLKIKESADAVADTAGYGQLWVDTATPNELAFTDDAGTDIIGIGKYHYETKFIAFNCPTNTYAWLPMNGYIVAGSSSTGRNEYQSFIAPYNGTLIQYQWRSEIAQGGSNHSFRINEAQNGTEIPGTLIYRKDYDPGATADDTTTLWDFSSPTVGSDPPAFVKGRLYMFYTAWAVAPQDTNITMVFKWDITS